MSPGNKRGKRGIALLRRSGGTVSLNRVIELAGNPSGMVLTHHDSLLIVAAGDEIDFIDVTAAIAGKRNPKLGTMSDGQVGVGHIYANATPDGKFAFISDERTQTITVIDVARAITERFHPSAIIGKIPVGQAPIALTFSPDGRFLYTTSQAAPAMLRWPISCKPEGTVGADAPPNHPQGAILIVDVGRAITDPTHSVVGAVQAGCNPVRLVLSPLGDRTYVSARGDNELLVFDTKRLISDSGALIARIPVGPAPVGIAVVDSGTHVVVTSSNRFAGPNDAQFLVVIASDRMKDGAAAVLGGIPAGAFPRELRVTSDGRTLILTNFGSESIQLFDLARLSVRPFRP